MTPKLTIAGLAAVLIAAASPSQASALDLYGYPGGVVSADLRPTPGNQTRALAQIGTRPGAEPRGVLQALLLPAVQKVRVVVSTESCATLADDASNTIEVGEMLVGTDVAGVSRLDGLTTRALRRSRSLALIYTGSDGDDLVAACGRLRMIRTASPRDADGLALSAIRLSGPVRLSFLGIMAEWSRPLGASAVVTGLVPGARYALALSARRAGASARRPPAVKFSADEFGTAYVGLKLANVFVSSLKRARTVTIGRVGSDGIIDNIIHDRVYGVALSG